MRRASVFSVIGLVLLTSSITWADPPSNGYIAIFGDAAGTQCCFSLPPVQTGNEKIFVFYVTGGAAVAGISGADFKITIEPPAPASATINWTSAQGIHDTVGDPIDNGNGGGVYIGTNQNQCLTGTGMVGDKILLGEIKVKDLYTEHLLSVKASDTPVNPNCAAPSVFLCDGPQTQVALTLCAGDPELGGEDPVGWASTVNSASCAGTSCGVVATEPTSWSLIKSLFR